MRGLILSIVTVIIAGCAAQPKPVTIPMPPPEGRCIKIPGKGCQSITAGNVGGTTLGHQDENIEENSN